MYPPIFATCAADSGVQAVLGTNPCRLYPFGTSTQGVTKPYAVWQAVGGSPENFINQVPDIDSYTLQIDCYATTAAAVREVAEALRDAIEPVAHVVSWRGEDYETDTKLYRYSFDVDWFVHR
jgi:hypothetical protein